jgi:hypothetical protein
MGVEFKNVVGLSKKTQIVKEDPSSGKSVQLIKYENVNDQEIKRISNGKINSAKFNLPAHNIFFEKIRLRENFFRLYFKKISVPSPTSLNYISNKKDNNNNLILFDEFPEDSGSFFNQKFIDSNSPGNNLYIQSNPMKLKKNDLKIEYIAYTPVDILLIGCKDKTSKLLGKNEKAGDKSEIEMFHNEEGNENEIDLKPALRYGADDYVIIPFSVQNKDKAKEEIDNFFVNEMEILDLKPLTKKVRKFIYYGGLLFFGYGYAKFKLKEFTFTKLITFIFSLWSPIKMLIF